MVKYHTTSSNVILVALSLAWILAAIAGAVDSTAEESDDAWDSRIRLAKRYFGPGDNRIRLTKKFPDSRIRLAKKAWDNRIRLSKKSSLMMPPAPASPVAAVSLMYPGDHGAGVPFFNTESSQRTSAPDFDVSAAVGHGSLEEPNLLSEESSSLFNNNEFIDRIVQHIISKYNRQNMMDKRGFIRLV